MKNKNHIGSNFDDFLEQEGIKEEINVAAVKFVIANHLKDYMSEALTGLKAGASRQ